MAVDGKSNGYNKNNSNIDSKNIADKVQHTSHDRLTDVEATPVTVRFAIFVGYDSKNMKAIMKTIHTVT